MNPPLKQGLEHTESGAAVKKSYKSPQLVVYGDVRNLTQASAAGGAADSHVGAPSRTA